MFRLLANVKQYAGFIIITVLTVIASSMLDLMLPNYMSNIINQGVVGQDISLIWRTGGVMLLISGASMVSAVIGSYCTAVSGMGFGKIVREKLFIKSVNFSQRELDKFGTPSLITRTTNDISQVQMLVMTSQRMIIAAPIMFIGGIIMAARKNADLLWVLLIILPIILTAALVMIKISMPLFAAMQRKLDNINLILREKLSGIRVIRAFNKSGYEDLKFRESNKDLADTALRIGKIMALVMPLMMLVMSGASLLILWLGGHMIDNPAEIGNLMAFIQYIMQIMMAFMMAMMMFVQIPRAKVSADRINEVLDCEYSVIDAEDALKLPTVASTTRSILEFKNISFSYDGAAAPVLRDINFTAAQGETVAIIGSTGSGKSTLVNLILRFYDATQGEILFHGVNIKKLAQRELRENIGYIPQKAFLFNGTVEHNIKQGNENISGAELARVLEIAQAADFVSEMSEKENSQISQGATNISGGQKQRLAIARALARDVGLYIFDDTFSALDFKTDARLRAAIKSELTIKKGACILIVAQRVGTIMNADKIIVLEHGEICGIGTHGELLDVCEVYREIVESQLTNEEIA